MPDELPLFPLGTVLFPGMVLPLQIFEARYRKLFARRAESDPIFGVVLTRSGREVGDQPSVHTVGTAASLLASLRYPDGRVDLAVRGKRRFRVLDGHWDEGYLSAAIEWMPEDETATPTDETIVRFCHDVRHAFAAYLDALERVSGLRFERTDFTGAPRDLAYAMCSALPLPTAQRQELLAAPDSRALLDALPQTLRRERDLLRATGIGGAAIDHPWRNFSAN